MQAPESKATVNFAVASGAATLSASSSQTDAAGVASVNVTLGQTLGPVRVTASVVGLPNVVFSLTVVAPVSINDAGVVGAALSSPLVRVLSVGGIANIFGRNFGAGATFQKVGTSDLVAGKVPTKFRGLCVDVSGTRAPVFGASDGQVNFQVPQITEGSILSVRVIVNCDAANQQQSNAIFAFAQAASPEFFYFAHNSTNRNPVAATDSITGAGIAAADLFPGSGFAPAHGGQYVTVYATGFGATSPPVAPGEFATGLASATREVRVFLDDRELPAANILYAGVTPFSPGLFQLNFRLPDDTPDGNLGLVIQIGANKSPDGAFLTVSKAAAPTVP